MCFSASASFAAAGVLSVTGALAIAREPSARFRMWTAIPLLFAAQQAAEGVVWLRLGGRPAPVTLPVAVGAFLGFALVVWPTWLPLSLLRVEPQAARQRRLRALAWLGALVSLLGAWVILGWTPGVRIAGHSIRYEYPPIGGRAVQLGYFALYLATAVLPLFVGSLRLERLVGAVVLAGLAATLALRPAAFTSVWCFFATAIGVLIAHGAGRPARAVTLPA